MTIEEMKARLGVIVSKLGEFQNLENFSDEVLTEVNALNDEYETLNKNIEAKQKIEAMTANAQSSARQVAPVAPVSNRQVTVDNSGGFKDAGEFYMAIKNASRGQVDKRFSNTAFEKNGEDGGYLVPEDFSSEINKKMQGDESLLSKVRNFPVSGNSLTLPTDEATPWSGGILAYWTAEGAKITESMHKLGQASWRLHKLAALVKVTEELLEDAQALESYIKSMAPEAITYKVNEAILVGDGVGKPEGILNSGFRVVVAKEVGQAITTIVARNVIKMYNRMLPASRAKAAFYINAEIEDELRTMKDDNGNFIYLAPGSQMNQSPYGLLMGRPVMPMLASMKQLGTEGDIIFADLSYYYSITKGGVKTAVSPHLFFDQAIQAFRFTMRMDGKCPFKSPVKTENGNYEMSAFVTLEDR